VLTRKPAPRMEDREGALQAHMDMVAPQDGAHDFTNLSRL
jgi:hypothetical protein